VTLCHFDHAYFTEHPNEWTLWVTSWMGQQAYSDLSARVHEVTRVDWHQRAVELTVRLTELQEELTV